MILQGQTILVTTTKKLWEHAQKNGAYTRSTITQTLEEVGFIHCTTPDQVMDMVPRFIDEHDVMLLLIDTAKLTSPLKYEAAKSGRTGSFPRIHGPLNLDAVYDTIPLQKQNNTFLRPPQITKLLTK